MGNIVLTIPDFADDQLGFDDVETQQILCFFWPADQAAINALTEVSGDLKRLAQTALVAAIEGTYAMGFIDTAWSSLRGVPTLGVAKWARKLASKLVRYTWRHAKQKDLKNTQVYESVRARVAVNLKSKFGMSLNGATWRRGITQIDARRPNLLAQA